MPQLTNRSIKRIGRAVRKVEQKLGDGAGFSEPGRLNVPEVYWMRATGPGASTGVYNWQRLAPQGDGTLAALSPDITGSGTLFEVNGSPLVPAGQIVRAWRGGLTGSDEPAYYFHDDYPIFPVDVVQIDGLDGTASTMASWTYDVYNEWGMLILSGVSPQNLRPDKGKVKPGTHGEAHYEWDSGTNTAVLTLGLINEVPNESPGEGDGQGYEDIRYNNGAVDAETDGGVLDYDDQQTPATGRLAVEWDLTPNLDGGGGDTKRTRVRGEVNASDLEVGGVGGSGGASVFNKTFRVNPGTATGLYVLDGDDYSGRTIVGVIQHHSGAIVGWQQDNFNGANQAIGKMGSSPVSDYRIVNTGAFEVFIDVSDGSKLKLDVKTSPSGTYYHFDCLITKGARKTTPDTIFS
ncbi:MAG: hypothetical protein AAGH88_11140 [Planctomycetota bacterium]